LWAELWLSGQSLILSGSKLVCWSAYPGVKFLSPKIGMPNSKILILRFFWKLAVGGE
jgi:hypothetical protein